MEQDLEKVNQHLKRYIKIIIKEYGKYIDENSKNIISSNKDLLRWENNSVSFFVSNGVLYLPLKAYDFFKKIEYYENYNKVNKKYDYEKYLDTSKSYYDYINSVIEGGLKPIDYFLESLLHEAMHICTSSGGNGLDEGINELITRRLAQKYSINIAAVGYNKEVEVALLLERILTTPNITRLSFTKSESKEEYLVQNFGIDIFKLYNEVSQSMEKKVNRYMFQANNPYEKAEIYSKISYDYEKELIKTYLKTNKFNL